MPSRSSTLRRALAGVTAAVVAASLGSLTAQAATEKTRETGRVTKLSDGDTPYVNIAGDGTKKSFLIRMIGIQATEIDHGHPGQVDWCHGRSAKKRLTKLLDGKQVQLRSREASTGRNSRPLRSIYVKRDGVWTDVARMMLDEGHVMWLAQKAEYIHNNEYHKAADRAARAGKRMWNTDRCGSGPYQNAELKIWAVWDGDGSDSSNPNSEYAMIKNVGDNDVKLGGWYLRDSSLEMYKFPKGTVLPAGQRLKVRVGSGTNTGDVLHWGLNEPVFDNVDHGHGIGDGVYLLDPDGDFRTWFTYPCVIKCDEDPLRNKLAITKVEWDPDGEDLPNKEFVKVKNVSNSRVRLDGYLISSYPYTYLLWGDYLEAGETLTLHIGKGTDSRLTKYWGKSKSIFNNTGDSVDVGGLNNVLIDCVSWRNGLCPKSA